MRTVQMLIKCVLITLSLILVGCSSEESQKNESRLKSSNPNPGTSPTLTPQQSSDAKLAAIAFRAAWGRAPPVPLTETHDGQTTIRTYRSGKLVPLGGARYALVSSGEGGGAHSEAGSITIHYLTKGDESFELVGSWPSLVIGGTFGHPPEWSVRTDLMQGPTLELISGGTWQGYTCGWTSLVELTPKRPIIRADGIITSYSSIGALGDSGKEMEGIIRPGIKSETFVVNYKGSFNSKVTYANVGTVYDPLEPPDLPNC